jgi:DNA-binding NarL/FixJ family response regulator
MAVDETETPVRRVLHVDDSPRMRYWLQLAVGDKPDLQVVGAALDSRQGVEMAAELHPDVIVLDRDMPDLDGLEALTLLHEACPEARLVMWCHDPLIRDLAIERGAADVVDKAAPLDQLVSALRGFPAPRPSQD